MKFNRRLAAFAALLVLSAGAMMLLINTTFILVPLIVLAFFILVPKDTIRNPKILLWAFFILLSVLLINVNLHPAGFSVVAVDKNSTIYNIAAGEVIYKIDDVPVSAISFEKEYFGTIKLETNKGQKFERVNGTLGIEIEEVQSSNIKFGLDLKGGVRALIEPNTTDNATIEQIIATLQTRINVYGLREAVFRPIYHEGKGFVEISIAGGSRDELRNLLENQGRFESKINFLVKTIGGTGSVRLDKAYPVSVSNGSVGVNGVVVKPGDTFNLSGISFVLEGIEADRINLTATVFDGSDVKTVYFDPQRSRIEAVEGGYRWSFAIQMSQEGAQKFAWATNNLDVVPGQGYLSAPIILYLDDRLVDSLSISSGLKGRAETEISVSGSEATRDLAIKDRAHMQSILKSGALPTSVAVVQLETISPTFGVSFIRNAILAGFVALIGVIAVVGVRYRGSKVVAPMIIVSSSEILIIMGIASVIGWTIDLPAIAGVIATIGSGINSQIVIIDQALRKEDRTATLKEKLKDAFFVIFGAGGTVIAAMLPLMTVGFGLLRGFAITTIIGVLVGILIVRPAFGVIVQKIVKE